MARTSKLNSIAGAAGRAAGFDLRIEVGKLGLLGGGEKSRLFGFPKPFCEVAFLNLGC